MYVPINKLLILAKQRKLRLYWSMQNARKSLVTQQNTLILLLCIDVSTEVLHHTAILLIIIQHLFLSILTLSLSNNHCSLFRRFLENAAAGRPEKLEKHRFLVQTKTLEDAEYESIVSSSAQQRADGVCISHLLLSYVINIGILLPFPFFLHPSH